MKLTQNDSKNHKLNIMISDGKSIVRTFKKVLNNGLKLGNFEHRGVYWSDWWFLSGGFYDTDRGGLGDAGYYYAKWLTFI